MHTSAWALGFPGFSSSSPKFALERLNLVNNVEFDAVWQVSVLAIAPLSPYSPVYHPLLPSFLTPTPFFLLACRAGRFTRTAKKNGFQEEGGKD